MKITERQMSELRGKILEAMVAASVRWKPNPTVVFESTQALDVGEVLLGDVVKILGLEVERP